MEDLFYVHGWMEDLFYVHDTSTYSQLFIVRSVQYWKAGNGPVGDEAAIIHCVHVVECQVLRELVERCGVGLSLRLLSLMMRMCVCMIP